MANMIVLLSRFVYIFPIACSQKTVTLTLWGETAIDKGPLLEEHTNPVVIITSCRVSDFDGNIAAYLAARLAFLSSCEAATP